MEPRKSYNETGSPILSSMILLTGITHCRHDLLYKNMNPYAMVMAYSKLVT